VNPPENPSPNGPEQAGEDAAGPERGFAEIETRVGDTRLRLEVQHACKPADLPTDADLARWACMALDAAGPVVPDPGSADGQTREATIGLRLVDEAEGAELNARYRGRDGATNVLSFPFEPPAGLPPQAVKALGPELAGQLGDLVICVPVLRREAEAQGKGLAAHAAHLMVHGTLHLLGYDHIDPDEADAMEALETDILAGLGFSSIY
jgi:probable rRNA maturation factor